MVAAGVLISGAGTNLQALIDAVAGGRIDGAIRIVISNRAGVEGLARAESAAIPTRVLDHRGFAGREAFDAALVEALRQANVDLVLLAGFDRLITRTLLTAYPQRVMNIHPALLPSFKGLHGQRQALEYGCKLAGATVHFVDEETDHGPIIVQGAVPVQAGDTEDQLRDRILAVEHEIYPLAVQLFAEGRLRIVDRRVVVTGDRPPPSRTLIQW